MLIPFLQRVIINNHTFYFTLIVRLLNLLIVRSGYNPDEWWQTVEVAHQFAFGKGWLTWEWQQGIRSYLYVAFIALIYKTLEILHLDYQFLVVLMPRLAQAIFSAYADSCFVELVRRESNVKQAAFAMYAYCSCWFIACCSTRTLINTVELNLTTVALYLYPFHKHQKSDSGFLWIVAFVCVLRPTAATVWLPLCLFHIYESGNPVKIIFNTYLPIGLVTLFYSTFIDSYFHGSLIFTGFRFLWTNVYQNVCSVFGTEPFHWYITEGLPINLGFFVIPLVRGPSKLNVVTVKLLSSTLFSLFIYSLIPHKEFRFILPLMPGMMFVISDRMLVWFGSLKNQFVANWVLIGLAVVNLKMLIYFGMFYLVGAPAIMEKVPTTPGTDLLIVTNCYATPFYSHIHADISARFIACQPNVNFSPDHRDEDKVFFENPLKWLEDEYGEKPDEELPTHIICFDELLDDMEKFLDRNNYKIIEQLFHSDDKEICLLERKEKDCEYCHQFCSQCMSCCDCCRKAKEQAEDGT